MVNDDRLVNSLAMEVGNRLFLVHHVPGRLRIKFDPSLAEHPDSKQAKELFPKLHAFEVLKINRWAKSALISYDVSAVSPALIDELFAVSDPEQRQGILRQIKESIT
mgnify:CR=1 FL=1